MARYHNAWRSYKPARDVDQINRAAHVRRPSSKLVRISYGKVWDGEFAPLGWRFQTPFEAKEIFNDITRQYKSARDSKKRFGWNGDHRFWSTQDAGSKDKAVRELTLRGYTVIGG